MYPSKQGVFETGSGICYSACAAGRGRQVSSDPAQFPSGGKKMNWLVDVFDRESVRREMVRSINERSLTLIRQMAEMSNR